MTVKPTKTTISDSIKRPKQTAVIDLLGYLFCDSKLDNKSTPYRLTKKGLMKMNRWELENLSISIIMMRSAK